MEIVKIGMLGMTGVLLAMILRREKGEYSLLISLVICMVITMYVIGKIELVFRVVEELEKMISLDSSYLGIILKMLGIAYVAGFAMDICKDSGYVAIGNQIETFAKLSILTVSLPLLLTFIETIGSLL